jgi:hypothetical protein
MNYSKIGAWLKGYVEALKKSDEINDAQLKFLILRLKEFILEIEKRETTILGEDDLPF